MALEINRNATNTYRICPTDARIIESRQNVANARWVFCARYASAEQARDALLAISNGARNGTCSNGEANNESGLDWGQAEKHLQTAERVYGELGMAGAFALTLTINPVRVRFNGGERTKELHDEIIEISL